MSMDLLALEIARAWSKDPDWLYDMPRAKLENLIGWWRATKCEYQPPKKPAKNVRLSTAAQSFWFGGE